MTLDQLTLAPPAVVGLHEVDLAEANRLLVEWGHYLGECRRPFGSSSFVLVAAGRPVAVAVSASIVSSTIGPDDDPAEFRRGQVVELARLASGERWATRVMVRLWREVCAPAWPYWSPRAAVAYSANERHEGRIYRFDGFERWSTARGSNGGGSWSTTRVGGHAARGSKTLWGWRFP